jgi:drug/metabolite transporter (DMT)-like permease
MLARTPARSLGAFEFTRTQLISSSFVLLVIVTLSGGWATVSWAHGPGFIISSVVGVILGNLAMASCLARGGPRRTQLLMAMNAPIAAVLGYVALGESMSMHQTGGTLLVLAGVVLAVLYAPRGGRGVDVRFEAVHGSFVPMVTLGAMAAACNAIGLIALKPALVAGTDPLAATAIRTAGGALIIAVIALWPAKLFEPASPRTGVVVLSAVLPGMLGYVAAVSLQLVALRSFDTGVAAVLGSAAPVLILPMIWIVTHQRPPAPAWAGAALVLLGVALLAGA